MIHTVDETAHVVLCGSRGRVSWTITLVGAAGSVFVSVMRDSYAHERTFLALLGQEEVRVSAFDDSFDFLIPLDKET